MLPRGEKRSRIAVLPGPLEEFVVVDLIINHDLSVLTNVMMMHLSCRSVALFFVSARITRGISICRLAIRYVCSRKYVLLVNDDPP